MVSSLRSRPAGDFTSDRPLYDTLANVCSGFGNADMNGRFAPRARPRGETEMARVARYSSGTSAVPRSIAAALLEIHDASAAFCVASRVDLIVLGSSAGVSVV